MAPGHAVRQERGGRRHQPVYQAPSQEFEGSISGTYGDRDLGWSRVGHRPAHRHPGGQAGGANQTAGRLRQERHRRQRLPEPGQQQRPRPVAGDPAPTSASCWAPITRKTRSTATAATSNNLELHDPIGRRASTRRRSRRTPAGTTANVPPPPTPSRTGRSAAACCGSTARGPIPPLTPSPPTGKWTTTTRGSRRPARGPHAVQPGDAAKENSDQFSARTAPGLGRRPEAELLAGAFYMEENVDRKNSSAASAPPPVLGTAILLNGDIDFTQKAKPPVTRRLHRSTTPSTSSGRSVWAPATPMTKRTSNRAGKQRRP